jgi:hypothetical protein
VAEGAGCGAGQVPSNGSPFTVDTHSVWILYWASTCDGTYSALEAALIVTAHNTMSGADFTPVIIWGPWAYGGFGLTGDRSGVPPAGNYILRVSVANPGAHHCQWRAAVWHRPGSLA